MPESGSKETNAENQDVPEEVQADGEPLLDRDSHIIRAIFHVQAKFCIFDGASLWICRRSAQCRDK